VTHAEWEGAHIAADEDVDDARRDLDAITAAIAERRLPLAGITRQEAAERIRRNLTGPPVTTEDLRQVAVIFGLTVRDGAAKAETLAASAI
jgi:hypothetical protein